MFHTDIYIRRNSNRERHVHAHYNYTSETIAAVRLAVVRIGAEEKYRGPYDIHIDTTDDRGEYQSEADFQMMLTDDFRSAYIYGSFADK